MKTQYYTATSLNGYIADEGNSLSWLLQFDDVDGMGEHYARFMDEVGALAMGSTTYEWIMAQEDLLNAPEKWPYAAPTWVFSRRSLPAVPGADIRFVQGDVRPIHAQMAAAAQGENIWIVGGGELAGQFHDHGLLDELILTFAPVMLAAGAPLLPRRMAEPPLKLTNVERYGDVFVTLTYEVRKRPFANGRGGDETDSKE
ncbi:MAG: dihydrofolate reductase [Caldilineaceae bacterium]|nr:dihydrofolate reductase [Caldilineaceae bacterium]